MAGRFDRSAQHNPRSVGRHTADSRFKHAALTDAANRRPYCLGEQFRKSLVYKDPAESDRILDALRSAGLPE